jgi:prophage antirepressor-like protein
MLKGFLNGVKAHLNADGEAWLILSDLAEHLGLRTRDELMQWIADAGLHMVEKLDIAPKHAKAQDKSDPLYVARSKEITSLYRLK